MTRSSRAPLLITFLTLATTLVLISIWSAGSEESDPLSPQAKRDVPDPTATTPELGAIPAGASVRMPMQGVLAALAQDGAERSDIEGNADPTEDGHGEAPLPAFMDASGSPETWRQKYSDVSWREIQIEADQITAYIEPLTKEDLTRLLKSGEYTVVGAGGSYEAEFEGDGLFLPGLERKFMMNDGETRRYRVSEDQYPDLFALARKGAWLRNSAYSKRRRSGHPLAAK